WNELHFYISHRLLHTPWLRRFHATHHRSHIATPFSTYAFHPVEALMLGSVPLLPMLAHDFSFFALASLPVMSIALNTLGHSNYEFSSTAPARGWLDASRRHHLHHACYHGNYGFLLSVFDRLLGTALPPGAADARMAARPRQGQARCARRRVWRLCARSARGGIGVTCEAWPTSRRSPRLWHGSGTTDASPRCFY